MPSEEISFRIAEIRVHEDASNERLIEFFHLEHERKGQKPFHVLALVEITSSLYVYERLLDVLHTSLNQAKALASGITVDPMARFEKIVQRVNEALALFSEEEGAALVWSRVNLYVFQLADEHICFSGTGHLTNIFFQRQPDNTLRAFDLLGSLEQPELPNPAKPLSAIVCGAMQLGDMLFLGTQNIQRVRDTLELTHLCKTLPPVSAATEITQRLEALHHTERFFGVLLSVSSLKRVAVLEDKPAPPEDSPISPDAHESVQAFYDTEQETERVLNERASPTSRSNAFLESVRGFLTPRFTHIQRLIPRAPWKRVFSLLPGDRVPMIAGFFLLFLMIGAGWFIQYTRMQRAEQKAWTTTYDRAVDAKNKAESALVFVDEARARVQLTQALQAFAALDTKTEERARTKTALEKELDDLRSRLRRERVIAKPTLIADFSEQGGRASGLVVQNGFAYTVDTSTNAIQRINLQDRSLTSVSAPAGTTLTLMGNGPQTPMLLDDKGRFYTVQGTTLTRLQTSATKASSTVAVTSYGKRVYTLDPIREMIWRWTSSPGALASETAYLPSSVPELSRAVSIAIDSSIYVGTQEGIVKKYLAGKEEPWSLASIEPTLSSIGALWTDADTNVLAISHPKEQRIVLFQKNGALLAQFISPAFREPTALWGDAAKNTLYVLDTGKLYQLDIPKE